MRLLPITTALTVAALSTASLATVGVQVALAAQPPKAQPAPPASKGTPPSPTTVIATVNGSPILMSDVAAAAQQLPPQTVQSMPPQQLMGRLVDMLISRKALLIQAKKQGLDKDPVIARQMQAAADQVLSTEALKKAVMPKLNEEAVKAQYDKEYAGKPGEEEVHARHILVDSEAKAKDIIDQLNKGAKFEDLAKKYGDPKDAATANGGDLGWFKKGDMLPEFSDVAFKLKPNEYTKTPVHTHYGWHVIQLLETRTAQPPTYDQVHDQIKQQLGQADVQAVLKQARDAAKIQLFNPNGTVMTPSAAPAKPAGK